MRPKQLFLLLLFLFISCTQKQLGQRKIYFIDDESLVILNGNVKQETETLIDDGVSNGPCYDIVDISKKGDVTKIVTARRGGVFQTYYVTKYDAKGKKLETRGYFKLNGGIRNLEAQPAKSKPTDTAQGLNEVYKYNVQQEIVNFVLTRHVDSTTYKYNNKGNLIEFDRYANPKLIMDVTKYKYDSKNNLIESDQFHWNKLIGKTVYEYQAFDSNNNWVEMIVHFEGFLGSGQVETYKMHRNITYY